jgi:hypothetical protein
VERLINAVELNCDRVVEILDLDGGRICDAARLIPHIFRVDVAHLSRLLLSHLSSSLVVYMTLVSEPPSLQLQAVDVKLALLIILVAAALRDQLCSKASRDVAAHEVQCFLALYEVMGRTESVIEAAAEREAFRTEQAILVFLRYFTDMVFCSPDAEFPQALHEATGADSALGICDRILRRIAISLRSVALLGLPAAKVAVIALKRIAECPWLLRTADPPIRQMAAPMALIEDHIRVRYSFTCLEGFKRDAVAFMSILASIALQFQDGMAPLVADLDARFGALIKAPTADAMFFLVRDLMGICAVPAARIRLLEWLFPGKLEVFRDTVDAVLEIPPVLNPLLKFWYRFLREDGASRSPARGTYHSADGIILFKLTAGVLITVFAYLAASAIESPYKSLRYAMLTFAEIMRADYVMFGAFELYDDPVLRDLLTPFIAVIGNCNIGDLFAYPKVAQALMETVKSLTRYHSSRVLSRSAEFFDFLIELITRAYQQADEKYVGITVDSAQNITKFVLEKKDEPGMLEMITRNGVAIAKLVDAVWDYHCNAGEPKYENQIALKSLLFIWPGALQAVYEKLQPQIPDLNLEEFETRFQDFRKAMADLGVVDDAALTSAVNQFRLFALGRELFFLER